MCIHIIAESEVTDSCKRPLNTGIDTMKSQFGKENYGQVSTLLSDGGTAVLSDIDKINKERSLIGKKVIKKRRCFAHVIRMPNKKGTNGYKAIKKRRCFAHFILMLNSTKGGGKRGGKGLLPRFLMDHGCPGEVMAKLMAKIILFNYLPDKESIQCSHDEASHSWV